MAQEQRGVQLLFSGLKLLSSSFQMHASHQRISHRLPRFNSVQRQGQTTTYRSLYEPNNVTPHHRNYISFYPNSLKPRITEALRKYPYRIFTNSAPTKLYLTIIIKQTLEATQWYTKEPHFPEDLYSIPESSAVPSTTDLHLYLRWPNQQYTSTWNFEISNHWQFKSNRLMQELPLNVIQVYTYPLY